MRSEIISELKSHQDPAYAEFIRRLTPDAGRILGVRVPVLRTLAKQILRQDPVRFLTEVRNESLEEDLLEVLVIGGMKTDFAQQSAWIARAVPKIRNWAVNDTLTSSLRRTVQDKEAFWKFLQPYLHSRQEQEQRFALISFKNCFLDETHLPRIFKLLQTLDCRGYYARMAAAWLIAECAARFPEPSRKFLDSYRRDPEIKKMALRKIRESFRTASFQKL
jgi:3-methyladenine DNA glycosylase AlkD